MTATRLYSGARFLAWLLLLCGGLASAGLFISRRYASHPPAPVAVGADSQRAATANHRAIDSALSLLRSGYMLLRTGRGADSYLLRQANRRNKTYSHSGIVLIEHGYPFVYHSIGGEDNPGTRLRRDSAQVFLAPTYNSGFGIVDFQLHDSDIRKVADAVKYWYRRRPLFDLQFDLRTDDKLYCTEFVYKVYTRALADTAFFPTTTVSGFTYVGVDDLMAARGTRTVWQYVYK